MDFFTFFFLACLTALLIYARKIENRRRRDTNKLIDHLTALISRVHALEQQSKVEHLAPPAIPVEKWSISPVSPAVKAPEQKPFVPPQPVAPPEATSLPPKTPSVGGVPLTPPPQPVKPPIAAAAAAGASPPHPQAPAPPATPPAPKPIAPPQPSATTASHAAPPLVPGMVKPVQSPPHISASERVPFSSGPYGHTATSKKEKRAFSLEEALGRNWLPKVGITLIVIGIAFLMRVVWGNISPGGRVAIIYAVGLGTLAGGIFLERKEQYHNLGRALIGGGWAITFAITYAIKHVQAVQVLTSNPVDLFLLLTVAGAMVWHTLKYNSQAVTGIAFLLGFVSVTLNPDPPYNLIAAAVLVCGLTVIVLRRQWFELEVFGILASYLNHLYWVFQIFLQFGHKPFPQYWGSVALMIAYWAIFRVSYLARKIADKQQEAVSTVAALLSPLLFLCVMKYQSFHPEWAFRALLAMGAVEFTLGQLPIARRRITPFYILSSLGATLMVMAIPFKYSGRHSLELLWMAGAEAFLLAGIFARERLFRQFAGIISLLVAAYLFSPFSGGIVTQVLALSTTGRVPHDAALSTSLAVVAALFYLNSHVLCRVWQELFDREVEKQAIASFSYIASLFSVAAIYSSVRYNAVAVVLAIFVALLAWTGKQFRIRELPFQAHWIAAVAVLDVSIIGVHLDAAWHSIPERLITFSLVSALLYLSSVFVYAGESSVGATRPKFAEVFAVLYRWAATGLIALVIWYQIWFAPVRRDWRISLLWIALALAVSAVGEFFKRNEFKWQAFVLAIMSFVCTLAVNFGYSEQFHHLSYRLISVSLVAGATYLLARWAPLVEIRPAYSWAGTVLLGYLAYRETQDHQQLWTPVLWIAMAAVLALAARLWKDRALLWQTHALSLAATGWTIAVTFMGNPAYRGTRTQLFTVLITSALLYSFTRITNINGIIESHRIWQSYSWAGSLLLSWLAWYQLGALNVSLAWGVLGLVLFEVGYNSASAYLRAQGYIALVFSFAHLFYSNFNSLPIPVLDAHLLLIVLLVPIYFAIFWRLHVKTDIAGKAESKLRIEYLLTCIGTATVAALARFEMPLERVVVGYALLLVVLLVVAWRTRLQIFLYLAVAMLGVTAFRLSMHNLRNLNSSIVSSLSSSIWAIALLAASIPIAFQLRSKDAPPSAAPQWLNTFARRPEQPLFFVTVILMAALLAIKLPDMITLAWGIEGVVVFLLALAARERSFRLTGFGLVVICIAKIAVWDAWRMNDPRARYVTFIGVGIAILVISYLYARYREALREYL